MEYYCSRLLYELLHFAASRFDNLPLFLFLPVLTPMMEAVDSFFRAAAE